MSSLLNKYKWGQLVAGILMAIVGIILIVIAIVNAGMVGQVISYVLAGILFIIGLAVIITTLLINTKDAFTAALVYGALAIAFGIILCINPNFLGALFELFIGVFLISFGAISLIKGILLVVYKAKVVWYVLSFIIAVACITVGILALIPETAGALLMVLYILTGALIIAYATLEIIQGIKKISK